MKTLGAIIRMCYGIGLLLCIVALFFPEGNVFRELAIYILVTVSVIYSIFNWYKEYKSKKMSEYETEIQYNNKHLCPSSSGKMWIQTKSSLPVF